MLDHVSAQAVFERLVAGAQVADGEVDAALAHAATCEECRAQFDLDRTPACDEVEAELPAAALAVREGRDATGAVPAVSRHLEECERCRIVLAELVGALEEEPAAAPAGRVDPGVLFERALTEALFDADATRREWAAEALGALERLGPRALGALADVAGEDPVEAVRAAALRALDELDAQVSIPARVIDAWAADPDEAAPFVSGVLSRLAGEGMPVAGVTELVGRSTPGEEGFTVAGEEGIAGRVTEEGAEVRLSLEGLPRKFEHAKLVVAIPRALEERAAPPVEWPEAQAGLVRADEAVAAGSLEVALGRVVKTDPAATRRLFERLYLLDPEARRSGRRARE